jgi:hypothetical protein
MTGITNIDTKGTTLLLRNALRGEHYSELRQELIGTFGVLVKGPYEKAILNVTLNTATHKVSGRILEWNCGLSPPLVLFFSATPNSQAAIGGPIQIALGRS